MARTKPVALAELLRTMPHLFEKDKISVVDKGVTHLTQLPERYHKVKVCLWWLQDEMPSRTQQKNVDSGA